MTAHFVDASKIRNSSRDHTLEYVRQFRKAMIEDFRKHHEQYGGIRYGHNFNPAAKRTSEAGGR